MPIFPGTVAQLKELAITGRPVLVCRFAMFDGVTTLYVSRQPLNAAEGGWPYAGHNYFARLLNQNIPGLQMRSTTGIDQIPNVALDIADPDRLLYTTIEQVGGFKGAVLTIALIFFAGNSNNFSSDEWIKFQGVCSKPQFGADGKITVSATATRNLSKTFTPAGRFQSRCGWVFPATLAQRTDGALNPSSHFYECGYCPDVSGTDPDYGGSVTRGNGAFTSCNYTKLDCQARGMYTIDGASRETGSFGGIQYAPSQSPVKSRSYLSGNNVIVTSTRNDSIYNQPIPEVYGTCWVNAVAINFLNDANSSRSEVVLSMGQVGDVGGDIDVRGVVAGGVWVPRNGHSTDNNLYRWNPSNRGARNHIGTRRGIPTSDKLYDSNGDPYGSMAMIEVVIYAQAASNSFRVLSGGQKVWVYSSPSSRTKGRGIPDADGMNPAWLIMDRMTWSNYQFTDLDIASFITEAAWCATQISFIDITGNANTHARFKLSCAFEQRRPTDQVVLALLNSCNGQLRTDIATGLRQFFIRKTLADQQPAPNTDTAGHNTSNYNVAVKSMHADGSAGNGYVAYWFNESTLSAPPVELARDSSQVSNRITFAFQNEENQWSQDSISVADTDDIARVGGLGAGNEVAENWPCEGICNFDQGIRVARVKLAEDIRGNELQDDRGSRIWKAPTNYRVAHLRSGDICLFSWQQLNYRPAVQLQSPSGTPISEILVRILSVEDIGQDFETASVTFRWHEDIWYTDAYGQNPPPLYSDPRKSPPNRPPYPWSGFSAIRNADDALFPGGRFFDFSIEYVTAASGDTAPVATVIGSPIVNAFSSIQPPLVPLQGTSTSTGGFISAGTRIYEVTAVDSSGNEASPSLFCHVTTAGGVTLGTNSIPIRMYDPATVSFNLYGGTSENLMTFQGNTVVGALVGGSIVVHTAKVLSGNPPDLVFDHFHLRGKKVVIPGVWWKDVTLSSVTSGTVRLKIDGITAADAWTGYIVSTLDIDNQGPNSQPNYSITGQAGDLLTLSENGTLYGTSYAVGEIVAVRATGKIVSANTIGDPLFVNAGRPTGLGINSQIGNHVLIIAGTGAGQDYAIASNTSTTCTINGSWATLPDATSVWIVVEPGWLYDSVGSSISNTDSTVIAGSPIGSIVLENTTGLTILVQVLAEDPNGNALPDFYAPFREVYISGNAGSFTPPTATPLPFGPNGGTEWPVYGDPLYAVAMFSLLPTGVPNIDGSVTAGSQIFPAVPANRFSMLVAAPSLAPTVAQATTGGSIPGGQTVCLALVGVDSSGDFTALSNVVTVVILAGTNTNTITITPTYDVATANLLLYSGTAPNALNTRRAIAPGGATITVTTLASAKGDSFGMPDANFVYFVAGSKKVFLNGIVGGTTGTITTIAHVTSLSGLHWQLRITGAAFTPGAYVNRVLSLVQTATPGFVRLEDYLITANDATTVTIIAPTLAGWHHVPISPFNIGDQIVIRLTPNIFSGITIGDSALVMVTDLYAGDVCRALYADGSNQTAFIVGNDATTFTLQSAFGSVPVWFWIEAASFSAMYPNSPSIATNFQSGGAGIFVPNDNIAGFNAVQVFASDPFGNLSEAGTSPIRDFFCPGYPGTGGSGGGSYQISS